MARVPKSGQMATTVLAPVLTPAADALRRDDDRELVRLAKEDDKEAFEILVKRHQGRVFAVAGGILRNKEDVEDIAQQVFVKAYFSLKRFDQRAAFSTWLYKITVNECWDVLRKAKVAAAVVRDRVKRGAGAAVQGFRGYPIADCGCQRPARFAGTGLGRLLGVCR